MPSRKSYLSINAAVMNCISRCAESDTPVLIFADFQEQLRLLGWAEKDVEAVARAVLPMISELKDGDTVRLGSVSLAPLQHQIVAPGQEC
jgi:hypothetical protein